MVKQLLLFSLAGVIVAGIAFRAKGSGSTEHPELAAPTTDAAGLIHVGALRLWRDYQANELAADNSYKDKRLRVTGTVLTVEKDPDGAPVLSLVSGNPIFRTMATLEKSEVSRAAALATRTQIVIECTGNGRLMNMPQLEKCTLVKP